MNDHAPAIILNAQFHDAKKDALSIHADKRQAVNFMHTASRKSLMGQKLSSFRHECLQGK